MKRIYTYLLLLIPFLLQRCSSVDRQNTADPILEKNKGYVIFPDAIKIMSDWSKENILVVHTLSDASYLHPSNYTFQNARVILSLTHPALLTLDQVEIKLNPCLAKALPEVAADEMQFTYTLLDEAVWDDGSPVTSEDVVFTYKVSKSPLTDNALHKSTCKNLKTIIPDPANPKRFTMVMKRKYVQAVSMVTDFPILSRNFFDPENVLGNFTME
ncbi:MAG: ABC transporter substrate-binding protein, partial [Chitinophagales bacterium]